MVALTRCWVGLAPSCCLNQIRAARRWAISPMLAQEQYAEAKALRNRGWSISKVARHLRGDRRPVRAHLSRDRVPVRRSGQVRIRSGRSSHMRDSGWRMIPMCIGLGFTTPTEIVATEPRVPGGHWWYRLTTEDFLSDRVNLPRPVAWPNTEQRTTVGCRAMILRPVVVEVGPGSDHQPPTSGGAHDISYPSVRRCPYVTRPPNRPDPSRPTPDTRQPVPLQERRP